MTINKKLILEIGCGDKKIFPNSIGLDLRPLKGVDVVTDARELPFENEYFDHVYSSHVVEHFSHREVKDVLREWIRVLKINGTFELRCPDLRFRALFFVLNPKKQDIVNIYGEQNYKENQHLCGFSYGILKEILVELGIDRINRIYDSYKGIPFLPSDLHVKGIKVR